jgi:hypothetical protein
VTRNYEDLLGLSSFIFLRNGHWFIVSGTKAAPLHKKKTALVLIVSFYLLVGVVLWASIKLRNWDCIIIWHQVLLDYWEDITK